MQCKKCGKEIVEGAKFCFECGEPVGSLCISCSLIIPDGAKVCPFCGTKQNAILEGELIDWGFFFYTKYGSRETYHMSWDVLKCEDGKALLLSHTSTIPRAFKENRRDCCFNYDDSDIYKYLEKELYGFDWAKDIVLETTIKDNWGDDMKCHFFLLSEEELRSLVPKQMIACEGQSYGWWLRDCKGDKKEYDIYEYMAKYVYIQEGRFKAIEWMNDTAEIGVRPAAWVDIDKLNKYLIKDN